MWRKNLKENTWSDEDMAEFQVRLRHERVHNP